MDHVFLSGNPALDLVGTVKWRRSQAEELLASTADLTDWIDRSGLVDRSPYVTEGDLDRAKALREDVATLVTDRIAGEGLSQEPVGRINAIAANPPIRWSIEHDRLSATGEIDAVLASIAGAAIRALTTLKDGQLKECARPGCTRVFVDRSRGIRRTWCGMNECGGQQKMAAYRRRQLLAAEGRRDCGSRR